MALPQRIVETPLLADALAQSRVRRCTFRRLGRVGGAAPGYEVSCLYPDRKLPLPIGDLESSLRICGPCSAGHIFRPDED